MDYYVETNLKWIEDKTDGTGKFDAFELDIYGLIRKQLSILIGEIWKTTDLAQKSMRIRDVIEDNKDFVRKIAKKLKIAVNNKNFEFYMQKHPMCQSAAYLMLKYRIAYIVCAVEAAVCKSNGDTIDFSKINDKLTLNHTPLPLRGLGMINKGDFGSENKRFCFCKGMA